MDENNSNTDQSNEGNVDKPKVVDPRPTAPEPNAIESPSDVSRMDDPAPAVSSQHSALQSKSKLLWAGVAAIVVLLFAAGAYAFIQYNQPENRIKRAIVSSFDAESLAATLDATINAESEGIAATMSGAIHGSEDGFYSQFGVESFEAGALALSSNFQPAIESVGLAGGDDQELNELYFKVSGIDRAVIDQYSASLGQQAQIIDQLYDDYHDVWIDVSDQIEELEQDEEAPDFTLSDEDREKLVDIIKDSNVVIIEEELESKEINSQQSDGFKVSPDFDGLIAMVDKIEAAELDIVDELNDTEGSEVDFDEIVEALEEAKDEYEEIEDEFTLEIWLDGDEFSQVVTDVEIDDNGDKGTFRLAITVADFDESLLQAPENSVPFEQLQEDFTSALFGGSAFAPQSDFDNQPQFDSNGSFDTSNFQ